MSHLAIAQTSLRGAQTRGVYYGDEFAYERSLGAICVFTAQRGVFLSSGTNVAGWNCRFQGLASSGINDAIPPLFYADATQDGFSTNTHAIISLPNVATNYTLCIDSIGTALSGRKPFTVISVQNPLNNGPRALWGLGWSSSSNSNGSRIDLRPSSTTATLSQLGWGVDTNSTVITFTRSGANTNRFFSNTVSFDGTSLILYADKLASSAANTGTGNWTFNQFTIGCSRQTNGNHSAATRFQGGVNYICVFTNALSGTTITNALDFINSNRIRWF